MFIPTLAQLLGYKIIRTGPVIPLQPIASQPAKHPARTKRSKAQQDTDDDSRKPE